MTGEMVQIPADAGAEFEAYLALPTGRSEGPRPALIVLPEIYNSNHWVKAVADSLRAVGLCLPCARYLLAARAAQIS